jgi:hypothetical protein
MDGANGGTTFTDQAGHTITRNGTSGGPQTSSTQVKYGSASGRFVAANSEYLSIPNGAEFAFGTGDFIVECWVYVNSAGQTSDFVGNSHSSDGNVTWAFGLGAGKPRFFGWTNVFVSSANTLSANQWHHLAVSRVGSNIRLFVDGVVDTIASATGINLSGTTGAGLWIGYDTNGFLDGYLDDLRIVKGQGISAAFTPPSAPYQPYDQYFSSVSFLAHCDDFTDQIGNVITNNGVTLDSSIFEFGKSWNFNGSSSYLTVAASSGFSFGTGDFTIEGWVYVPSWTNNTNGKMFIDSRPSSTNGPYWDLGLTSTGRMQFTTLTSGGVNVTAPSIIPTAQWVFVAVTRAAGRIDLWINGVSVANVTGNTDNISSSGLLIGKNTFAPADAYWNGNMDDIRITKGVARYTANFTPPTPPFANS